MKLPPVRKRNDYRDVKPDDLVFALFQDRVLGLDAMSEASETKAAPLLSDALDALDDAAALFDSIEPDATKAGRRNSTADQALIDAAYEQACALCDLLEALGASGDDEDEDEMPEPEGGMVEMKTLPPAELDDGVKFIGDDGVAGYAVRFGSADEPDISHFRDYFTKATDYWLDAWQTRPMLYHHAQDEATKDAPIVGMWTKARVDDVGIWLEGQLNRSHAYYTAIKEMVRRGVLKLSSDSAPHLVVRERQPNGAHEIKRWPLLAASLTPTPAEPRLLPVTHLKSLYAAAGLPVPLEIDSPEASDPDAVETAEASAVKTATDDRARRLALQAQRIRLSLKEKP